MAIKAWGFQGSGTTPPEPQKAYNATNTPWSIPGVIQMEDFDVPGVGRGGDLKSFQDNDAENHGDSDYRKDDAPSVDLYKKSGDRVVVGYIQKDEWLEYTVNVAKTGTYTMYAAVASDGGSSFKLSIDGKDITEDIAVPAAQKTDSEEQNFDDYAKVKANVKLEAGEHILRFTATADWFDIDFINFEEGEDAPDQHQIGTEAIGTTVAFEKGAHMNYDVFDLKGNKLASFKATSMAEAGAMWQNSAEAAKVQGISLIRNRASGKAARVRSIR